MTTPPGDRTAIDAIEYPRRSMNDGCFDADGPGAAPKRPAWRVKLAGGRVPIAFAITSEPVPAGERVIAGLLDDRVAAFDAGSGAEAWSAAARCVGAPHPVVLDGAVFFALDAQEDSSVRCIDLETGATRWNTPLPRGLKRVAAAAGHVFAILGTDVVSLDAESGRVAWRIAIQRAAWQVGIVANETSVFVTANDGSDRGRITVALDFATGSERWRFAGEGRISPCVSGGDVFCAGPGTTLAVVDAASGALRWRGPDQLQPWSAPAVASDIVVVARRISSFDRGEPGSEIHALDRATGSQRWRHFAPGDAYDPHVAVGRTAIYATGESVRALRRATGELLWEWSPPKKTRLERRPAVSGGMLFVPSDKGLFALR